MASPSEDISEEPPSSIDPYQVLNLDQKATADEVKSAYKKAALRHHPDKARPEERHDAHQRFQEIAFAYAILSDQRRRARYDVTGSTEESLDLDDDDFNWVDFYRQQWAGAVTLDTIADFHTRYVGSDEERAEILASYTASGGNLRQVFQTVMFSNALRDEPRFREIIDAAIARGEVEAYEHYVSGKAAPEEKNNKKRKTNNNKPKNAKSTKPRQTHEEREEAEARDLARSLGIEEKIWGNSTDTSKTKTKTSTTNENASLAALFQQRGPSRSADFLARLEEKYSTDAPSTKKKSKRTRGDPDNEPSEEAFRQTAERAEMAKRERAREMGGDEEEENGEGRRMRKGKRTKI
ncbi:MAG: hypothetical protein M1817_005917 [Caeruleum heppii]|nr:MAG: hypothetical protein M1817_005917 [Caeruleum heppii]